MSTWHVLPIADLREHEASPTCWCHPVEDTETEDLYLHNSLDGREAYERGELQPQ